MKECNATLTLYFYDGKKLSFENVTNFNLVKGCYFIFFIGNRKETYPSGLVREFYYAYTKY